jgi:hypothetical protein
MPIPTPRPSLTNCLVERYDTQRAGGAFDAKNIPTVAGTRGSAGGLGFGLQEVQFTIPLFRIASWAYMQQSDFRNDGNDLSIYVQGLDTTKYITGCASLGGGA